ncbi:hypothetical protein EHQ52_06970 [Leptospira koniambonensis]|uniref:GIY-YIG domain-containing protein n=1 Tax=Leptospira koniambonensis TaxID=2484950 RepID=A0A4R9J7R2_9LEPT|nr:GIY-YIG nuclease family protein [Leptospira koniambonensis]TGL34258.1 hypothetical protein EHQ52_06970 [Leptospira koniambonensis]
MKENKFNEVIPGFSKLIKFLPTKKEIRSLKLYSFKDFYTESKIKDNQKYYLNKDFIQKNFQMNSKKKEQDTQFTSLKGLYIFFENDEPIYVGISGNILYRIKQHMTGRTHFSANLAYLIAVDRFKKNRKKQPNTRESLWKDNRKNIRIIQKEMRELWKIAILPQSENYMLYLKEIYLACELKTKWNSFATH